MTRQQTVLQPSNPVGPAPFWHRVWRRWPAAICMALLCTLLLPVPLRAQFWLLENDMPDPRTGLSAVALDGAIYVMGGRNAAGEVTQSVAAFDPFSGEWESGLPSLLQARENATAVVHDGAIYVLCGRGPDGAVLNSVESWRPGQNSWQPATSMIQAREGLTAVSFLGALFAIGGFGPVAGSEQFLSSVEFYDQQSNIWQESSLWSLDLGRTLFQTVVVGGNAYSLGGLSAIGPLNLVQILSADGSISDGPALNMARGGHAAAVTGDTVFVIGGRSALDAVASSVEMLLPGKDSWFDMPGLIFDRENAAAAAVAGRVYVFGGRDNNGEVVAAVESFHFEVATDVDNQSPGLPESFILHQNYPNPFNAGTTISFFVPEHSATTVTLQIFTLRGQLVRALVNGTMPPGEHSTHWDGRDDSGQEVASGLYLCRLRAGQWLASKKMLFLK